MEELAQFFPAGLEYSIPYDTSPFVEVSIEKVIHTLPEGHIPDGLKIDANGDYWITTVASGGVDHVRKDGTPIDFLETGGTILNCCFGKGGKLFCCDMGPFDVTGAAMTGRLIEVDGRPLVCYSTTVDSEEGEDAYQVRFTWGF